MTGGDIFLPETAEVVGEGAPALSDYQQRRRARLQPTLALRDAVPVGRPPGEVGQALLDAMRRLATPTMAPTLLELAVAAQVGKLAAKHTLANLVRSERVCIVRRRWVAHRRSPVAEYAVAEAAQADDPRAHLVRCLAGFVR